MNTNRAVFTMNLFGAFLLLCVLSVWTVGQAIGRECSDGQTLIKQRCCNMCPPGTYLKDFCSDTHQTICSPCVEGYYSDKHHIFDRCKQCQSCQQEYSENCTSTTRGTCSCWSGFLCSNNLCSHCEKNKCEIWEKPNRTEKSVSDLTVYSYQCEPKCSGEEYFDVNKNTCKPWTKCSDFGLAEGIPGNKSHDRGCSNPEMQRHNQDFIHVSLCIGFVLFSLSLFIFVSYTFAKNLRKWKNTLRDNKPHPVAFAKSSEFHLSKEESGIQDDSKDSNSSGQPSLEKVQFLP